MLTNLKQGRTTLKEILLGNLPDFQQLQQILRLAYVHQVNGQEYPPFLMENPQDLFIVDKLLEPLQTADELSLPPLQNAEFANGLSPRSLLYQALNSTSLPYVSRRKYFKALGDILWKRYLEF